MDTNRMRVHAVQLHENRCTSWSVQSMMINAYIHGLDEPRTVSEVNLVDYLGKTKQGQWGSAKGRKFYLADYNDDSTHYRNNTLLLGLNEVCCQSGFALVSDGYRKDTFTLSLLCTNGLLYQDNAKTKAISNGSLVEGRGGSASRDESGFARNNVTAPAARKRRKTSRPLKRKDRCRFRFQLFWDAKHRLWYFYEFSAGIVQHNGHCQLRPEEVRVSSSKSTNVESMDASETTIRTTENLVNEGETVDFPVGDYWSPPDVEPGNAELDNDGTDIVPTLQINFARPAASEKERIQERLETDQVYDSLLPAFERLCQRVTSVDTYHMLEQTLLGLEAKIDAMSTATGNEARVQCQSESNGAPMGTRQ